MSSEALSGSTASASPAAAVAGRVSASRAETGAVPLDPVQYGEAAMVPFPPEPEPTEVLSTAGTDP